METTKWQQNFKEWQRKYGKARSIAESIDRMIRERCRKLSIEAGLDPNLLGIHPHNAMVSYEYGKPWQGVNYSLVRKILWLQREKQFAGYRLADAYGDRLYKKLMLQA